MKKDELLDLILQLVHNEHVGNGIAIMPLTMESTGERKYSIEAFGRLRPWRFHRRWTLYRRGANGCER